MTRSVIPRLDRGIQKNRRSRPGKCEAFIRDPEKLLKVLNMRHRKSGKRLNRTSSHRKAMFRNMMVSLFKHEMIKTTLPKAKELRRFAEPLITMAKEDSVAKRRLAFSRLRDDAIIAKLFTVLGPRYKSRPGGYLRILKAGYRPDDSAPVAIVELVDRLEVTEEAEASD